MYVDPVRSGGVSLGRQEGRPCPRRWRWTVSCGLLASAACWALRGAGEGLLGQGGPALAGAGVDRLRRGCRSRSWRSLALPGCGCPVVPPGPARLCFLGPCPLPCGPGPGSCVQPSSCLWFGCLDPAGDLRRQFEVLCGLCSPPLFPTGPPPSPAPPPRCLRASPAPRPMWLWPGIPADPSLL